MITSLSAGWIFEMTWAGAAGIPFSLSTLGTTSIEDVQAANPNGRNWFQLYVWRDRGLTKSLVERAAITGYEVLMVTADVPVFGQRERDHRNGATIPPRITLRNAFETLQRPACGPMKCATAS